MVSRFRQRTWSAATTSTSLQLTSLACMSSWNVVRQVYFGRPLLLLPSVGLQSIAQWAGCSDAIQRMCPANQNIRSLTMSCNRRCQVVSCPCCLRSLTRQRRETCMYAWHITCRLPLPTKNKWTGNTMRLETFVLSRSTVCKRGL